MKGAALVAYGAVSAFGTGESAVRPSPVGVAARVAIGPDPELELSGLARPFAARAPFLFETNEDRAALLLERALTSCARRLDRLRTGWRAGRVGLILGTSSGGMRSLERWLKTQSVPGGVESASYFGPMARVARSSNVSFSPYVLVLGACASSTLAIGLALRELAAGSCDLVLAGGFDAISVFVAAGFESLGATSRAVPPQPFRVGRDGMALGEGAAVLALERGGERAARAFISGFGASTDAVHLTAPDRTGTGLSVAMDSALRDAGVAPSEIDLVSAHATATPFNDAAEAKALARANIVAAVHPMKASIGHTLGAAGALELLGAISAMHRGVVPAAVGEGASDPEAAALDLPPATRRHPVRNILKLSSAFGGANAALVATRSPMECVQLRREAYVSRAVHVPAVRSLETIAASTSQSVDRLSRLDPLTLFAIEAVFRLSEKGLVQPGPTGVVVGHSLATLETNARYYERLRTRGARFVEPRRFPYTSPNAVAGECALMFGLTGPSFAVGSGLHGSIEALTVAAAMVRAGDVARVVVVAVCEVGDVARRWLMESGHRDSSLESGAVALVVSKDQSWGRIESAVTWSAGPDAEDAGQLGYKALLPFVFGELPLKILAATPGAGAAAVRVVPVDNLSSATSGADKLAAAPEGLAVIPSKPGAIG